MQFPQVLLLTLKRFKYVQRPSGAYEPRCVMHPVQTTELLDFQGQGYALRAVVVHLGASLEVGHYVTLAQHRTQTGSWWLYDDAGRKEATADQLATTTSYKNQSMKSYVFLFEKQATA